jgi:uncharacterized protein (TIGR03437 family)
LLTCLGPHLLGQQYCANGAITSVLNCNSCNFNVGDPVAVTFTVAPASVTCLGLSTPFGECVGNASISADVGVGYWSEPSAGALLTVQNNSILISDIGGAAPSSTEGAADGVLFVSLSISGLNLNLLAGGKLPATLPSPAALAAAQGSLVTFSALTELGSPQFSYTGQTCASAVHSPPSVAAGGVVPVGSTTPTIQPGEWVSIFGTNLASATATWNGDFPVSLGGTSVTVNGKLAYLWYVSPGQINLQAPDDTATGPVSVVVTTSAGNATATVTLAQFAPSFLLLDTTHVTGIIRRSNGSGAYGGGTYDIIGPTGNSLGSPTVAAKAGDTVELYALGLGPTDPRVLAGKAFSGAASTDNSVTLLIDNVTVTPLFAGLTGAGLYQINLTIPSGLGNGDVPLEALVGGVRTQAGVVISLQ